MGEGLAEKSNGLQHAERLQKPLRTSDHSAKDGVLEVQVVSALEEDEELHGSIKLGPTFSLSNTMRGRPATYTAPDSLSHQAYTQMLRHTVAIQCKP